jgi:hypothetical protein
MSDFERRISESLHSGAESAPDALGLAEGARRRLRTRRRRLTTVGAVVAVVAVGVPVGLLSSNDDRPGGGEDDQAASALDSQRVSCGTGTSWPVAAMDGGEQDLVDEAEVRAAFEGVLEEAPMDAPQSIREQGAEEAPYIALNAGENDYTLGTGTWTTAGPGKDADVATLERQEDGSLRMTSWGDCHLRVAIPPGRSPVEIKAPKGGVDGGITDPVVMVNELDCTSGRDPRPFLGEPELVEDDERVLVTMSSERMEGGADCQGNPSVPITLRLDQPIGDRELLDGGTWPPTPVKVAAADGWQTVEHEGVLVDVPANWNCDAGLQGPACVHGDERLNFYASAIFDPVTGPGLFDERDWVGYVYAGDWAVSVQAADRDEALRILGSARVEGETPPDLSHPWRTVNQDGVSALVPAFADGSGYGIEIVGRPRESPTSAPWARRSDDGSWWADVVTETGFQVRVRAPTRALVELIGSQLGEYPVD